MTSFSTSDEKALPIQTLSGQLPDSFVHVHAFLIFLSYWLQFGRLVNDPAQTLVIALVPLSLIQAAYAVTCLPFARKKGPVTSDRTSKSAVWKKAPNAKDVASLPRRVVVSKGVLLLSGVVPGSPA